MQLKTLASLFLALCLLAGVTAPAAAQDSPGDIVEVASANEDFSTLTAGLEAADLVETLQGEGPFTVFAPTNAAFDSLSEGTLEMLMDDPTGNLAQILRYHVVPGEITAEDIRNGGTAETLEGSTVVFAAPDDGLTVDGVNIVTSDIEASNGVIHVIDALILPVEERVDVVDVAAGSQGFDTLVTALQSAQLADSLRGEGPFTLFAPTNAAFEALPEGQLDALLADPSGELTQILLYHVVAGEITAGDIQDGMTADTLQGSSVEFSITETGVEINNSNIITVDLGAANGFVHGIDGVLSPPAEAEGATEGDMAEGEEMAEGDTAEDDMAEDDMAEGEEMAGDTAESTAGGEAKGGDMAAPDSMPATGGNFGGNTPLMLLVIGAVVVGLVGATRLRRRV